MKIIAETLSYLFAEFDQRKVEYCILRNYFKLPYRVGNDVDILIQRGAIDQIENIVNECADRYGWELHRKENLYFILYKFVENSWISLKLDFVTDLKSRGLVYFSGEPFIASKQHWNDSLYILSPTLEFVHILVHSLFGPSYNISRYKSVLKEKLTINNIDILKIREHLKSIFHSAIVGRIIKTIEEGNIEGLFKKRSVLWCSFLIKKRYLYSVLKQKAKRWLGYMRRLICPPGLFVVFVGPDGVGKSTTAKHVATILKMFNIIVAHYHLGFRPGILPYRNRPIGGPSGEISVKPNLREIPGTLRLLYYTLDYILGYYIKIRPLLIRHGVAVTERYYYDYLVDFRRKKMKAPFGLVKALFKIIPKPDMVILLYDSPEVIYERKEELSIPEIKRHMVEFERLGRKAKFFCKIPTVEPPDKVAIKVTKEIVKVLYR